MDCSTPGFPVHHQLPEPAQTHVSDAIQPSNPLSSPSPPVFNLSQYQGLFQGVSSSHQVAKVLDGKLESAFWGISPMEKSAGGAVIVLSHHVPLPSRKSLSQLSLAFDLGPN